ncbi:chorismate mutase [Paraburkholderia hayleyella]|uniref:chorismate mutase n=1 Tax=Paraburkholderia hayleyella TaxID=2152889 RepID=UPI00129154F4|nr:chorismate mutase [Paraburkholderia hayleyella]
MKSFFHAHARRVAVLCAGLFLACPAVHASSDESALTSLIALVSQRLTLAEPLARLEWANRGARSQSASPSVATRQHEAQLFAEVEKQAKASGVDPVFAHTFFQDQIDANRGLRQALFDTWRNLPPGAAPEPASSASIQNRLDRFTPLMILALSRLQDLRTAADCPSRIAQSLTGWKSLTRDDSRYTTALNQALSHICETGGVGALG